ncbi:MAG TPA: fluoride efflux transporter CrcB [Thermoanaerobaculia bacterium]|nr:fluoride efflux transporter CrcB [Thermoanaerobaculia bacterium]
MRGTLVALVFVGGGIGSVLRYGLATAVQRGLPGPFPAGTFAVNLLGSFAIGLVGALGLERAAISPEARVFLMVGILGGFTTFSSLAWETLGLLSVRDVLRAALYAGGSVLLGLAGAWLGRRLGRMGTGRT